MKFHTVGLTIDMKERRLSMVGGEVAITVNRDGKIVEAWIGSKWILDPEKLEFLMDLIGREELEKMSHEAFARLDYGSEAV